MKRYNKGQIIQFQSEQWIVRGTLILDKELWLALYRSDGQWLESMLIPESWLDTESRLQELKEANAVI